MTTTRICVNCKKEFSIYYIKDGIKKHSDKRKFCYDCSPVGGHNTKPSFDGSIKRKNISKFTTLTTKFCKVCSKIKLIEDFYDGHLTCKICHTNNTLEKQRSLKKQCVDYLGGKCIICGYDKYQGALHFHHRDMSTKEFSLSHKKRYSFEYLKGELDKCILVCANCHSEIHAKLVDINNL